MEISGNVYIISVRLFSAMDIKLITHLDNIHQSDVHLVVKRDWYVDFIVDLEYNKWYSTMSSTDLH